MMDRYAIDHGLPGGPQNHHLGAGLGKLRRH